MTPTPNARGNAVERPAVGAHYSYSRNRFNAPGGAAPGDRA